jgi:hypothetical protein
MRLAVMRCVRSLAIAPLLVLVAHTAAADPPPLYEAELRLGYGVAVEAGADMMATRPSPLTIAATGSIAVSAEPQVAAYAGLVAETLHHRSVGATAGARLTSPQLPIRLAAGGVWMFAPYTLWGLQGSAGACMRGGVGVGLCADLQLTAYVAGTDLAPDETITQVQGVIGLVFDAF